METREILIGLKCTDKEAEQFEGRKVMVVPLDDWEINELGGNLNGVSDYLGFASRCLAQLDQIIETKGSDEPEIAKTLRRMIEPTRDALALQDRARQIIGRAMFVSGKKPRGVH